MLKPFSRILVVGHNDVIENSLYNYFRAKKFKNAFSSSKAKLDTLNQKKIDDFFKKNRPEYVFLGSVRSGGIVANQKYPAEFLYENLVNQNNVIHAAYKAKVKKLLYFGASCVYPKASLQPIREEYFLTGKLEATSEAYSIAKIAGIELCRAYNNQYGFKAITAVPATVYGPGSDTDIETAHVMGALIGKFYEAKAKNKNEVIVWGSGMPRREFLYADDFVSACLFLMEKYEGSGLINIGCGADVSIRELAEVIRQVSGFRGKITFDTTKPDGAMAKLMDNKRIMALGWKAKTHLIQGIQRTYDWYKQTKGRSAK